MPGDQVAELNQPGSYAGFIHQVSGKNEERNGQKGKGLRTADHFLDHDLQGNALRHKESKRRDADSEGHRESEGKKNKERYAENDHTASSFTRLLKLPLIKFRMYSTIRLTAVMHIRPHPTGQLAVAQE